MGACRGPAADARCVACDILILGRMFSEMFGIFPNAELDRIARSKFERPASAYTLCESLRISVISPEEDPAMAPSLESKRVISYDGGTPEHLNSRGQQ